MTVSLTVSKTMDGSAVADSLTGGSNGYDFGTSETGDVDPDQKNVFVSHDGSQAITNLAVHLSQYAGTYGGEYSAAADLALALGHGDGGDGMQADFDWDAATPFTTKTVFKTGVGATFVTRVTIPVTAMAYNNAGTETSASSPVAGSVGPAGNTVLGDFAHMRFRYVAPSDETESGKRQFDLYYSFNFVT